MYVVGRLSRHQIVYLKHKDLVNIAPTTMMKTWHWEETKWIPYRKLVSDCYEHTDDKFQTSKTLTAGSRISEKVITSGWAEGTVETLGDHFGEPLNMYEHSVYAAPIPTPAPSATDAQRVVGLPVYSNPSQTCICRFGDSYLRMPKSFSNFIFWHLPILNNM